MTANTEAAILGRLIEPEREDLLPETARYFLALDFHPSDRDHMNELAEKSQLGALTPDEQAELGNYVRVGHLLALLQSKARRSLKNAGSAV